MFHLRWVFSKYSSVSWTVIRTILHISEGLLSWRWLFRRDVNSDFGGKSQNSINWHPSLSLPPPSPPPPPPSKKKKKGFFLKHQSPVTSIQLVESEHTEIIFKEINAKCGFSLQIFKFVLRSTLDHLSQR